MPVRWPDAVDHILDGDQALVLAYATPAHGVVLSPVTNFALRDRAGGLVAAVNTSVGMWQKLDRVRSNPNVALAYHTRRHGRSARPEYVLVQGRASLTDPHPRYLDATPERRAAWERAAAGSPHGPEWWLRAWHERTEIWVDVERIVVWPDLACAGEPVVHGSPLPDGLPESQRPPRGGTAPRVRVERAARRAGRLEDVLLGWIGADGLPAVAPVAIAGAGADGIALEAPAFVPPGGRRAGLTAHSFERYVVGHEQRLHTGWLQADGDQVLYAPHTERGYRLPASRLAYALGSGFVTRRGYSEAQRRGLTAGAGTRSAGSGP